LSGSTLIVSQRRRRELSPIKKETVIKNKISNSVADPDIFAGFPQP
jgi:hypothetical protein